MVAITVSLAGSPGQLRAFNASRDLKSAADLVDLCFATTLDPDGQSYLKQLRDSADGGLFGGMGNWFGAPSSLPVGGYVWEESRRLVGYLSVIPFFSLGLQCYLIANVSVHPDFRGRGIGRALTARALEHARQRHAHAAWLQVRHDNASAIHIYQLLGFEERARRTSWVSERSPLTRQRFPSEEQHSFAITGRSNWHWQAQRQWLDRLYPPELAWHMSLDRQALEASVMGSLYRFFMLIYPQYWVAQQGREILGILSRLPTDGYADSLWLAVPPVNDDDVIQALLWRARQQSSPMRALSLNFPADVAVEAIQSVGFRAQQTLMWMEYRF